MLMSVAPTQSGASPALAAALQPDRSTSPRTGPLAPVSLPIGFSKRASNKKRGRLSLESGGWPYFEQKSRLKAQPLPVVRPVLASHQCLLDIPIERNLYITGTWS